MPRPAKPIEYEVFMILYSQGLMDHEIAAKMHIGRDRIINYRIELGLPKQKPSPFLTFYAEGLSDVEIGKETGATIKDIRKWRRDSELPANNGIDMALDINTENNKHDRNSLFSNPEFIENLIKKNGV